MVWSNAPRSCFYERDTCSPSEIGQRILPYEKRRRPHNLGTKCSVLHLIGVETLGCLPKPDQRPVSGLVICYRKGKPRQPLGCLAAQEHLGDPILSRHKFPRTSVRDLYLTKAEFILLVFCFFACRFKDKCALTDH